MVSTNYRRIWWIGMAWAHVVAALFLYMGMSWILVLGLLGVFSLGSSTFLDFLYSGGRASKTQRGQRTRARTKTIRPESSDGSQ